jgi:type VI secretion system secreted protein Hcp
MAFDAFLKIKDIPGESQDSKHKDWIEIMSYSFGAAQNSSGGRSSGGAATGQRVNISDFSVVKALDKASPVLFEHCCNGKHIGEIVVELCRATGDKTKYMEYKLTDVIVSSYRPGGSSQGGEPLPLEELSFNPGRVDLTYTATDHKTGKEAGKVAKWWSVVENKGG